MRGTVPNINDVYVDKAVNGPGQSLSHRTKRGHRLLTFPPDQQQRGHFLVGTQHN